MKGHCPMNHKYLLFHLVILVLIGETSTMYTWLFALCVHFVEARALCDAILHKVIGIFDSLRGEDGKSCTS